MSYSAALTRYLGGEGRTQAALADAIGTFQPNIHRWATGARFPDRDVAEKIADKTNGEVPFEVWQREAAKRAGLDVAA